MKDGDTVKLTKPCKVDRYYFDNFGFGRWDFMFLLPGAIGTVIKAKTPCVRYNPKTEPAFFANVDVAYMGAVYRVREFHNHFRVIK